MELTINSKSEIENFEQDRIFQGSDDYNKIQLYAPFQEDDIDFRIAFRLPDNTILGGGVTPIEMTFISYDADNELGLWELSLDTTYTEQWGYTKFSIYGRTTTDSKILATQIVEYYVEESIDMTPFE